MKDMSVRVFDFQASMNYVKLNPKNTRPVLSVSYEVIQNIFERSKSRWIDDLIIRQWRNPEHKIYGVLSEVNDLYTDWISFQSAPFALSPDPLWLDIGRALASVGLPWHNNQVNLPTEIDTSWPFHFKSFEAQVIRTKGARVGDANATGYVSSFDEANLYCIRALQQHFRQQLATQRPILAYDNFDTELILSAAKLFGLEVQHVNLCSAMEDLKQQLLGATSNGIRPLIFAATLCNSSGEYDDLNVVSGLSHDFLLLLHVDSFRSFDYITVSPNNNDRRCERLMLGARDFRQPLRANNGSIWASTIVAGGMNFSCHDPAIALKPASLGEKSTRVAYIRAFDSTLSGSRDAIAPLWIALYEERLGNRGLQELFRHLLSLRSFVLRSFENLGISASTSPYSTDIIVKSCSKTQKQWLMTLGGTITAKETIVLSINPRLSAMKLLDLLHTQMPRYCDEIVPHHKDFVTLYPLSQKTLRELQTTTQSWQIMSRSITGYPLHLGSYSALGPVIGQFWEVNIPKDWIERKSQEILSSRMEAFGLASPESRKNFKGAFTTGSTMGNRCGIMNALEKFPSAFIYFSTETHYSVIKTLRDCDTLTNRWTGGEPRYSQIRCDFNGSIRVEALVQQALADKSKCIAKGIEYHMILLVNIGTTFVGATDNLFSICQGLKSMGIQISYIHADGALDFGFDACGVKLGPPGAVDNDGMPLVQGITLSHHKALGNMVSGEVLCFSPQDPLSIPRSSFDPRAVFETWFYNRVYSPADMALMLSYCRENASRLEMGLNKIGVATKRNDHSIITVLERPPSWIIEEFSLRPEGDWVHFITMPHVSKDTVDRFLDQVAYIDKQFSIAFSCVTPLLNDSLGNDIELKRVRCCSALAERVSKLIQLPRRSKGNQYQDASLALNIKSRLRGALSIVAVDKQDKIQVVFVAGSDRDQSIHVGPLFIRNQFAHCKTSIEDISKLLVGLLARYLKAKINIDDSSYQIYYF
ncbi:PLP-dependent transferase [Xylaria sp. FL1777]|nr:PLP-dependent transferase [Xylaria sp. FL1777]